MPNDPMPWQLAVRDLRAALEGISDDGVIALHVPPGNLGHPQLESIHNLYVRHVGRMMLVLSPGLPPGLDVRPPGS